MADAAGILLVEDEVLLAAFLERAVRRAGYDVVGPFFNVADALQALQAPDVRIDAAILDLTLRGGETSLEIAEALRRAGIPFFFLTGDDSILRPQIANGDNPPMVLYKPIALARLLDALHELVAGSRA